MELKKPIIDMSLDELVELFIRTPMQETTKLSCIMRLYHRRTGEWLCDSDVLGRVAPYPEWDWSHDFEGKPLYDKKTEQEMADMTLSEMIWEYHNGDTYDKGWIQQMVHAWVNEKVETMNVNTRIARIMADKEWNRKHGSCSGSCGMPFA